MKKIKTIVSKIEQHSAGVYSLFLDLDGQTARFKAGQFLHLALDEYDPTGGFWPESRVFSICSRPGLAEVRVIYSVKGTFTKQMENELKVGRTVWIKIPFGEFIIDPLEGESLVLVAGGTGISPFIPFIENLNSAETSWKTLTVFYGVRTPDQLIFSELLAEKKALLPKMHVHSFVELGASGNQIPGRISPDLVAKEAHSGGGRVYLSGPPVMISYFQSELIARGIPQNQILIDAWE